MTVHKFSVFTSCLLFALLCLGCSNKQTPPTFHNEKNPELLSEWGQFTLAGNSLIPNQNVTDYHLITSLFSDYAHKLRTVWLPSKQDFSINQNGTLDFPVGTVISKTFYYPELNSITLKLIEQTSYPEKIDLNQNRLIETRLLVKRDSGWVGLPYIWNPEQTEARLQRYGDSITLSGVDENQNEYEFNYSIPDVNQCSACHQWDMQKPLQPIGLQTRHLDRSLKLFDHVFALEKMSTTNASYEFAMTVETIETKARAYLDINCSHCHNPDGPGNTSGLDLGVGVPMTTKLGLCKLPIAAGPGTGNRQYDINPGQAENSIFTYRMESKDPASMMPELGRSLVHHEGLELVKQWINSLEGRCD